MTTRPWLQGRPTYSSKAVTSDVEGQTLDFYPMSADIALMLKAVAKPIAKVLAFISGTDAQKDQSFKQVSMKTTDGEDHAIVETQPITREMAEYRASSRAKAVDEFLDSLLSEEVRTALGCAIIDSIRPRSDTQEPSPAEGAAFAKLLDLVVLKQYLVGVAKANGALIGPLAGQMGALKGKAAEILSDRLNALVPSSSPSSPTSSAASAEVPPTPKEP